MLSVLRQPDPCPLLNPIRSSLGQAIANENDDAPPGMRDGLHGFRNGRLFACLAADTNEVAHHVDGVNTHRARRQGAG
jgi:hypothetical protein